MNAPWQIHGGRSFATGAVTLLLLAAFAGPSLAATPDPILGGGLYAQGLGLTYRWSSSGTPPTAIRNAINAGVADANATRQSQAPTFTLGSTGSNLVYYGVSVPCGVNGLACMRRDPPDWFGVWYRENGHRFDWGSLRWCEMTGSPNGCFEARNVALHEFGHVMILDHHVNAPDGSDAADAIMQTIQRAKPAAGWNAHAYARCDVATLQQQYDVIDTTTRYSTCLDVPTTLQLFVSNPTAPAGSTLTFIAVLQSNGTGRLADNRVTGRTVVLQQRTAAGWTDLETITASTNGTYGLSRIVWSTADYRAVFRSPVDEGLRTSVSATVPVTVYATCMGKPCPYSVTTLAP